MNREELEAANEELGQKENRGIGFWIKVIIAIIVGLAILAVVVAFLYPFLFSSGGVFYPFIPTPRNTLMSTNRSEFITNLLSDANETGVDYSVFSRQKVPLRTYMV